MINEKAEAGVLSAILLGTFVALLLGTTATAIALAMQHGGREMAAASVAADLVAALLGFRFISSKVSRVKAVAIALIYFPTIVGLMFFAGMYLDAWFYGNTF